MGKSGFMNESSARLLSVNGQEPELIELADGEMILGRDPEVELHIDNGEVSRQHARISSQNGLWVIEDLNSSNGTWVGTEKITRKILMDGDVLKFGSLAYRFEMEMPDKVETVIGPAPTAKSDDATMLVKPQEKPKPAAKLVSQTPEFSGLTFALGTKTVYFGRDPAVELHLDHKKVSRKHAKFFHENDVWWVEDLGSTNGIRVNGKKLNRAGLASGDVVRIGPVSFRFQDENKPEAQVAAGGSEQGGDDSGGEVLSTMLFDDVRASEALIKAMETDDAQEQESLAEEQSKVSDSGQVAGRPAASSNQREISLGGMTLDRKYIFAGGGVVVFLLLVVTLFSGNGEQEGVVNSSMDAVRVLMARIEDSSAPMDSPRFKTEMEDIRTVNAQLRLALSRFPDSAELVNARATMLFLQFERDLNTLLVTLQVQDGLELVDRARNSLNELKQNPNLERSKLTAWREVKELLELGEIIVRLSIFAHRYSDPGNASGNKPDRYALKEVVQYKKQFIQSKKANHLALSVNFPYFQRMVEKVDEQYLRVINRWDDLYRRGIQQ